jgi:hypothetical protein
MSICKKASLSSVPVEFSTSSELEALVVEEDAYSDASVDVADVVAATDIFSPPFIFDSHYIDGTRAPAVA